MPWLIFVILLAASPAELDTGIALRQEGRIEEAIRLFEDLLSSRPDDQEARRELGHALTLGGRYREAIEAYQNLAESSPAHWQIEAARWQGLAHLYLGEIDSALELNARESELARQSGDRAARVLAAWYRIHILTELGRFREANSTFLEALDWAPDDIHILHHAGVMTARQGDAGSLRYQIEDLQKEVQRSGDETQMRRVYHLQAELALLQGEPKKALERIERANRLAPHPFYRDVMARAHLALGNPKAAEEAYRDIVTSTDERLDIPLYYVMALRGLAEALDAQGQTEAAASCFEKFLSHWGEAREPLPGVAAARSRLATINVAR